ncbi:bile acid:sodium symporter [Altererythrobacter aurantiacus]|uniref:Bile acid:sodium symporter n=1 Tax=Parapontixanthobacter aurantiacus TaxID=1463599 RepID=A0A844ZD81_9SPHN|nr:bile acid:sodium symporter [Parapontixanthobacter aurantiacus]MXO85163.1 bile acid:sodium symporter [Parapontixanthobacter aurantiacus]
MLRLLTFAIVLAAVFPAAGSWRSIASDVSSVAIFLLFFLNGIRITREELWRGTLNWRFLLPLVLWTFLVMGCIGLLASKLTLHILPATLSVGFLFLGVLPSTVQSATSYSMIAGGNGALSVVSAAILSVVGIFASAPLFLLFGGDESGAVGLDAVTKIVVILILPLLLGLIVQPLLRTVVMKRAHLASWADRFVIAIAVYVALSGAVEQGLWQRVSLADWAIILAITAVLLTIAHAGAWWLAGCLQQPRKDRISFMFAGAQKSAAIGAPLAAIMFEPDIAGFVIVPLLLYHLLQLVVAAPIAARLNIRSG